MGDRSRRARTVQDPDPFHFPSDTDFRFALLIAVVAAASLFIFRWLYHGSRYGGGRFAQAVEQCFGTARPEPAVGLEEFFAASGGTQACMAPINLEIGLWMVAGVLALFAVALLLYWLTPHWIIRRAGYEPLTREDAPQVLGYLRELCVRHQVHPKPGFLWNPLDPSLGGLAFGRWGRYYVALTGGLVTTFFIDRTRFDTVILHELSHFKNRDVDKTYWSVAVWRAFLLVALLPLMADMLDNPIAEMLRIGWRVAALATVVYLVRNAVLRARELFADARMGQLFGDRAELVAAFASILGSTGRRRIRLLATHPSPERRLQTLNDPGRLLRFSPWDAGVAGIGGALVFASLHSLLSSLAYGTNQPLLPAIGAGLLVGVLAVGIVGLGLWRETYAARVGLIEAAQPGLLGLAFGLGLMAARPVALEYFVEPYLFARDLATSLFRAAFGLLWALGVLLALALFFRWLAAGAQAWTLVRRNARAPGPALVVGLLLASVVLAAWLGPALWLRGYDATVDEMVVASSVALLSLPTVVPPHPLTHFVNLALWVFPLAGLVRARADGTEPPTSRLVGLAKGSMVAVIAFALFVFLARLLLHLSLPTAARESDAFKLSLYGGHLALAFGLQAIVGMIVALRANEGPVPHALAAAFLAGTGMTAAMLLLSIPFGGTPDLSFLWTTFSHITVGGGAIVLALALPLAALRGRRQQPAASS